MEDTSLSIVGPGIQNLINELQDLQTLLGTTDTGDALSFCVTISRQLVAEAIAGRQMATYDATTAATQLFSHPYLDTLLEIARESSGAAPEDPLPD